MNTAIQTKTLPKILTFGEIKYYIFSLTFTGLAVFVPWFLHNFTMAGSKFLPMHFFVMIAGFLFGWRTGLIVGAMSPLLSYSLTQMPAMAILPQVILELVVYGLAIGILRERKFNIWVSLFSAMILGRIARILFIFVLLPKADYFQFIKTSLPGMILQILLIPFAIYLLQKFVFEKNKNGERV